MKEYWEDGTVSWFTVEDIYEQGRYISDTKQHITELATKKCFVYPIDTVLICCTASVGEYAITKKEMASNQQFNGMIIKDKNKVHPEFLLYVASTLKDDLLRKAGKTTINFVSRSKLEEIEIPVPAIEEQKRFISIFQQSDKSKFVGFKSQFIEMFGDCQQLENISSLCDTFIDGDWIESKDQSNEGIRLIQTGYVGNGFFKNKEDQCRFISNETFDKLHCTEIFPGDILVARLPDPIGRSCIIPDGLGRMITAVDCSIIRLKASILPYFFIAYTMTSTYSGQINEVTTGTTRRRVSRANLGNIKVPTPPTDQQKLFVSIAEQADKSKLIELSNKCYHKIYSIPTIQKKLLENGSPKATIETDESRSYFLIDIPCRKDFVQDDSILRQIDIHRVTINLMTKCPRYVQDMSKIEVEHLSVCILKSRTAVSAQIMLEGVDKVSYKQKRRKYLDKLLEMGVLLMTIPEKPTSRNQQYILSEYGKGLLE